MTLSDYVGGGEELWWERATSLVFLFLYIYCPQSLAKRIIILFMLEILKDDKWEEREREYLWWPRFLRSNLFIFLMKLLLASRLCEYGTSTRSLPSYYNIYIYNSHLLNLLHWWLMDVYFFFYLLLCFNYLVFSFSFFFFLWAELLLRRRKRWRIPILYI